MIGAALVSAALLGTWLAILPGTPSPAQVPSAGPAMPATNIAYPGWASATRHTGLGFDACTAPSLAQMRAWLHSPYRVIGVSISGPNHGCPQPYLNAGWVTAVSALGWQILPLDQGLQAPCSHIVADLKMSWDPATARSQGRSAASAAAAAAGSLGMYPGSAIYADMEGYRGTTACRVAVLSYLSGWTQGLHAAGYLSGVYSGNGNGVKHLTAEYFARSYARPDAVWGAWYNGSPQLTGWPGVPDTRWPEYQRARQYTINVDETHGGVTLRIDNDNARAPVATVSYARTVTGAGPASARSGPGTSYRVVATYQPGAAIRVTCHAQGSTGRWDKLSTGAYLRHGRVATPGGAGPPTCRYPYQVTPGSGAALYAGPAPRTRTGTLPAGALAWIICHQQGPAVGGNRTWDKIAYRRWIPDRYVASPGATSYSGPAPRC